jgi:hypothetical protein
MDFILGNKSLLLQPNETRISMTSGYMAVKFDPLFKVVTAMTGNTELCAKYPLTEVSRQMLKKKDILTKLIAAAVETKDFGS